MVRKPASRPVAASSNPIVASRPVAASSNPIVITPSWAISERGFLYHDYAGPSWDLWRIVLKAAFGEALSDAEQQLFYTVAERSPPKSRVRELWCCCGRRAGKDSIAAAIAVVAALNDYSAYQRTGQRITIACLAVNREQAKIIHGYISGYFSKIPALKQLVEKETDEVLLLRNGVEIVVSTNSFRAIRGKTIAVAILDEVAYWRSDDVANPDREIYNAIEPSMLTIPTAMMIGISSPHQRRGLLFEKWREHYGKDSDDVLVVKGASRTFNPTLPQHIIDKRLAEDPEAGAAEYLAEWRSDLSDFIDRGLLDAAVDKGITARPPVAGIQYYAFGDMSGGRGSSSAVAIAHANSDGTVILDAMVEYPAPHNPKDVIRQIGELLRSYGISAIHGDKYAGNFPPEAFAEVGIVYLQSERDKSAIFIDTLPLFASGKVRLLDNHRLIFQFASLERRVTAFGRDRVSAGASGTDDAANAVAGALLGASRDARSLVKAPTLLAAEAPVPLPALADSVMCVMVINKLREVACAYFAVQSFQRVNLPAPVVLIDATLEPLGARTVRDMAERLKGWADWYRARYWTAWCQAAAIAQINHEGFDASVIEDEIDPDPEQLAVLYAIDVEAGRFRVAEHVAGKAALPLAEALSIPPGQAVDSSVLRMAVLLGTALGIERPSSYRRRR